MSDSAGQDEQGPELQLFSHKEVFVYANLPPATSFGHRAQLWGLEKYFTVVSLRMVSLGDDMFIRLIDRASGALFAECPVPKGTPVDAMVCPVQDSSRYFVLKLVDAVTKQHAFVGIGFRDREAASDFMTAMDSHKQYLRKQQLAQAMREEYEAHDQEAGPSHDYSLKPGQTLHINLGKSLHKENSTGLRPTPGGSSKPAGLLFSDGRLQPPPAPAAVAEPGLLPPPPPPGGSGTAAHSGAASAVLRTLSAGLGESPHDLDSPAPAVAGPTAGLSELSLSEKPSRREARVPLLATNDDDDDAGVRASADAAPEQVPPDNDDDDDEWGEFVS